MKNDRLTNNPSDVHFEQSKLGSPKCTDNMALFGEKQALNVFEFSFSIYRVSL